MKTKKPSAAERSMDMFGLEVKMEERQDRSEPVKNTVVRSFPGVYDGGSARVEFYPGDRFLLKLEKTSNGTVTHTCSVLLSKEQLASIRTAIQELGIW